MATQPDVPFPFGHDSTSTGDMRAHFEALSKQTPRDAAAEQAFIHGKIELVRGDPTLSEAEKERAIAELRKQLGI